ncbi:MAG: ribonuclease HII [Candidatus Lokiarchaeota archaeon]|nr:ribonuclease HII [Candidatus Lokiarchaeota archaeon]
MLAGVDEAGRGCAIGPLVMCIAVMKKSELEELSNWEVKDSKLISPKKRKTIYDLLIKNIKYKVKIIKPKEIDQSLKSRFYNLNWLEADISAELTNTMLEELEIKKIILDCPSNNIDAYTDYFEKKLTKKIKILAEHKADLNYPIVSAASIIAKVTRDKIIEDIQIKNKVKFGSGYTSDSRTRAFLKEWYIRHRKFPDFVRKRWKTVSNIMYEVDQKKIDSFFD